mmetsp:Transcript_105735/g.309279  ORF Transcript_105735/g.309279 Transcript_105735/m.309279 type:complete len:204 (+) Transcript_105735:602-1213(+)
MSTWTHTRGPTSWREASGCSRSSARGRWRPGPTPWSKTLRSSCASPGRSRPRSLQSPLGPSGRRPPAGSGSLTMVLKRHRTLRRRRRRRRSRTPRTKERRARRRPRARPQPPQRWRSPRRTPRRRPRGRRRSWRRPWRGRSRGHMPTSGSPTLCTCTRRWSRCWMWRTPTPSRPTPRTTRRRARRRTTCSGSTARIRRRRARD